MAVLDEHHLEQLQRMLLVAGSRAEINENKGLGSCMFEPFNVCVCVCVILLYIYTILCARHLLYLFG